MVDFRDTSISPIPPAVTVQQGTANMPSLTGVGDLVKGLAGAAQLFTSGKGDKVMGNFTQEQLRVARAVEQGHISSAEGRTRMRTIFGKYAAENPSMIKDFSQAQSGFLNTAGIAKIVEEGTDEEKRREEAEKNATDAGFISVYDTDEQREDGLLAWEKFQRQNAMNEIEAQDLEIRKERATTGKAELEYDMKNDEVKAREAISRTASTYSVKFSKSVRDITKEFSDGSKTPEERMVALQALESEWAVIETTVSQLGAGAGNDYINNQIAPMRKQLEVARRYINGEVNKETLDNYNSIQIAQQKSELLSDPHIAKVFAVSQLTGENPANIPYLNREITSIFLKNGINQMDEGGTVKKVAGKVANLFADSADPEEKQNIETYLNSMMDSIRASNSGTINEAKDKEKYHQELNANLNSIVKGISVYGMSVERPEEFNALVTMLGDREFGKYVEGQGGVPRDLADAGAEVVKQQYEQVVVPLIKDNYSNTTVIVNEAGVASPGSSITPPARNAPIPASEAVDFYFNGDSVVFKAKEGVKVSQRELRNLNRSLRPLNNLIRTYAHLKTSTDYQAEWETLMPEILGTTEDNLGGGAGSDTIDGQPTPRKKPSEISGQEEQKVVIEGQEVDMSGFDPEIMAQVDATVDKNTVKEVWSNVYQSENSDAKEKSFEEHQSETLVAGLEEAIDKGVAPFLGDKGIKNLNNLKQIMVATAKHESLGGRVLEQGGGGPARGPFQVEPATARDIIKTSGLIGPKAEDVLGKTKKEILDMSDEDLSEFLKDFEVNSVFAAAKYIQASDAKGALETLRTGAAWEGK